MGNDKARWPPHIPAVLDDANLLPADFRIVGRIARRAGVEGECWESARGIVKGCRLHKNTVWKSLKRLIERGMVKELKRPGQTTVFTLAHPEEWITKGETGSAQKERQVTRHKKSDTDLAQKERHKGSPLKVRGGKTAETFRHQGEAVERIDDIPTY